MKTRGGKIVVYTIKLTIDFSSFKGRKVLYFIFEIVMGICKDTTPSSRMITMYYVSSSFLNINNNRK